MRTRVRSQHWRKRHLLAHPFLFRISTYLSFWIGFRSIHWLEFVNFLCQQLFNIIRSKRLSVIDEGRSTSESETRSQKMCRKSKQFIVSVTRLVIDACFAIKSNPTASHNRIEKREQKWKHSTCWSRAGRVSISITATKTESNRMVEIKCEMSICRLYITFC